MACGSGSTETIHTLRANISPVCPAPAAVCRSPSHSILSSQQPDSPHPSKQHTKDFTYLYNSKPLGRKVTASWQKFRTTSTVAAAAGLRWLVQGAKAGDSLFMHYSGHGGSLRDSSTNGDEEDKKDETMIPADYVMSGHIRDDQLLAELVLPLPEGVVLSVVMDCCHSGSILDLPYAFDATEGSLKLVDAGGSGIVPKKSGFNMDKLKHGLGAFWKTNCFG